MRPIFLPTRPDMEPKELDRRLRLNVEKERAIERQQQIDREASWTFAWKAVGFTFGCAWWLAVVSLAFCLWVLLFNAATDFVIGPDETAHYWMRVFTRPTWASFFAAVILYLPAMIFDPYPRPEKSK